MNSKLRSTLGAGGFVCSLLYAGSVVASTIENAVDTTGMTGFIPIQYGDHTINSAIDTVVDVDSYRFTGAAGDQVRAVISSFATRMDPVLELRGPSGAVLKTTSCDGFFGCSVNIDESLPSSGTYVLSVSDVGVDETGGYTLHMDRYPPLNNWTGLLYDRPLTDVLGHMGDHDFLAFNGAAGTSVRLAVSSAATRMDPHLEVWDPNGVRIYDQSCDGFFGCSLVASLDLSIGGLYRLGLSDINWDETGGYNLGLTCQFGNCPSVVPIPPAVWLLASGLLGLVGVVRPSRHRT